MKTIVRLLLPSLALAATLPLIQAGQPNKMRVLAEADAPENKIERHMKFRHDAGPRETETVAFLGVETVPVGAALTAQLALPKNTGLVVREIVPDSPAAAALQVHDILLKLDDQWLIDSRQFSVLVRNHQEGDEIALTYVRGGKQATAKVKLAKHEMPKLAFNFGGEGDETFDLLTGDEAGLRDFPHRENMQRVLSLLDRDGEKLGPTPHRVEIPHRPGFRAMRVNPENSNMVFSDDKGSLELTIKDGKKSLVVKAPKGEQVFAGPIDTPEQRKALPPEIGERLEKLENMQEFSFEPDATFEHDVKFIRPGASKIVLPLPPRKAMDEAQPPSSI